jgi:hypothetical protein
MLGSRVEIDGVNVEGSICEVSLGTLWEHVITAAVSRFYDLAPNGWEFLLDTRRHLRRYRVI